MPDPVLSDLGGWPYAEAVFDKDGDLQAAGGALVDAIGHAAPTDLVVFSHGWNTSRALARALFRGFLGLLPPLVPERDGRRVATLGVFWPSQMWSDEPFPDFGGAAAALVDEPGGGISAGSADPVRGLVAAYDGQQCTIKQLADLLDEQPDDPAELARFVDLMGTLATGTERDIAAEDGGALGMLTEDPQRLAARFAAALDALDAPGPDEGGAAALSAGSGAPPALAAGAQAARSFDDNPAAGIGSITGNLWNGAKEALRQFTYWQMKRRAGVVGEHGLGPLLGKLAAAAAGLRIHLVGHSFGARLVSYALRAVPAPGSPVRSVTLLQGAFSHFAYARALPQDPGRAGALAGRASSVAGPIVICHSAHDLAVGVFYPLASLASRDDASALDDSRYRWGGMGHDGAQAVGAATVRIGPAGTAYGFRTGFTNVDASGVVRAGGPPSGAHSDVVHPEVAWVVAAAAGLA